MKLKLFHDANGNAVDIAFFDVSFGLSFVDKLKLLVPSIFQIFKTDYRFSYIISFLEMDTETR
ncbi:hypothetical protein T03_5336 [Trichinella britovi]|uniref:Uncharacterized protein n=1 Tax=Trichinella britovi TaxID=45882 RepID=A0A0V1APP1_TRIBR|nr:hypothetical protein T03_5336 [Trichinella britovi]